MAYNAVETLFNITDDPIVAKNHHCHAVPRVLKSIDENERVAALIKDANGGVDDEHSKALLDEAHQEREVLNKFYAKWPAPTISKIEDQVDIQLAVPAKWWSLPLSSTRPDIPLTLMNDPQVSATLFYKDEILQNIFKVPNIKYNQPNNAQIKQWAF